MGRSSAAITKTKILMLRETKRVERPFSKIAVADHNEKYCGGTTSIGSSSSSSNSNKDIKEATNWIPHPKNGIYFPKGHEWVMNDVPDGAASLDRTFWLRNVDGVEKPDPDE